jgi:hypothetical protein
MDLYRRQTTTVTDTSQLRFEYQTLTSRPHTELLITQSYTSLRLQTPIGKNEYENDFDVLYSKQRQDGTRLRLVLFHLTIITQLHLLQDKWPRSRCSSTICR